MSEVVHPRMTAEAFLAWSLAQPKGRRYELVGGEVVRMHSERAAHARTKLRVAVGLSAAIRDGKLPCEVFGDGMAVRVDEGTTYEPDALVRCGEPLDDEAVIVDDPVIVVEVVSPSSQAVGSGAKLADYFRIPSVVHYLIVRTKDRAVIVHSRSGEGEILTRIVRNAAVALDPPGLSLPALFR